jgi:hypothetical protein
MLMGRSECALRLVVNRRNRVRRWSTVYLDPVVAQRRLCIHPESSWFSSSEGEQEWFTAFLVELRLKG